MRIALSSLLLLCALVPTSLPGQTIAEACSAVRKVTVGQWAGYQLTTPGEQPMDMRMAIIGTEQAEGREHYWFEMKMTSDRGPMVLQVLVPEYPYESGHIRGMVMKAGNEPAMKMPAQMISMMGSRMPKDMTAEASRKCSAATEVGWERIEVPAGPFRALHLRPDDGGDVWVSLEIPFGLVKMTMADGTAMALTGKGADAKSSITEKPMEMPGMRR